MTDVSVGDNLTVRQRRIANLKEPWKPGQSGNPAGRPKGSRARLAECFLDAMYDAFQDKGKEAIDKVIKNRPHEFIRAIASLLPKEFTIKDATLDELGDNEITDLIAAFRAFASAGHNLRQVRSDRAKIIDGTKAAEGNTEARE